MMAKEGSMLLSVLRFPSLHLLHMCDIISCTCRNVEDAHVNFWWYSFILGVTFKIQLI